MAFYAPPLQFQISLEDITTRAASLRAMPLRGSTATVVSAGDRAQDRLISTALQHGGDDDRISNSQS
eukprot:9490902-Pyramimonas_sp.AAC.1